jgi:RNA polymerase sigma-70 factor (ECF subfamily)
MSPLATASLIDQRRSFLQFVERQVRDRATAEDILQASYARAFSKQATLREDESATAWFYRILRNAIIDHYRHGAVEARVLEPWTSEVDLPAVPEDSSHSGVCHCIGNALDSVRPAYGKILREVDLADAPHGLEMFAKKAGITSGNAAVRAHRARQALKKQLLQSCGACAETGCLDCSCD